MTRRRYERGMEVRREVLGDAARGPRRRERTSEFTADFQDLITRYAWGEIWARPGLDRRTRSCITLTALVAGGHDDELAPAPARGPPQRPHAGTRSRRCCSRARSTAACRRRTARSRSPSGAEEEGG